MSRAKQESVLWVLATLSMGGGVSLLGCNDDGGRAQTAIDSLGTAPAAPDAERSLDGEVPTDGEQDDDERGDDEPGSIPGDAPDDEPSAFLLQLLHASDMEAGAQAVQDAPRFSAVLESLRGKYPEQTLTLASGDTWISGPFYTVSGDPALTEQVGIPRPGRTDILMLNAMGFQASALGNHEFDFGTGPVASLIAPESANDEEGTASATYPGAAFPYLSANLLFTANPDLAPLYQSTLRAAGELAGKIAPATFLEVDGQTIGIVAATTPTLSSISSPGSVGVLPETPDDYDALAQIIQAEVDGLSARGVDKIVLVAHMQQIAVEQTLAAKLRDVDIIVAGGSNTLLADETDRLRAGDRPAGPYPIMLRSSTDEPVAVVNTDGNYRYVGRLVVGFDARGVLIDSSIDSLESGAYATDEAGVVGLGDAVPNEEVQTLAESLGEVLNRRDGNIVGATDVYLDGRRSKVRTEETNFGDLTADANLFVARDYDPTVAVSLKNGGGIRSEIGYITFPAGSTQADDALYLPPAENPAAGKQLGDISQFDIETSLSFNNTLAIVSVTAAQLERLLEHAVAGVAPGATPGQFFQVGGMRVSFDPTLAAQKIDADHNLTKEGERIRNAAIVDEKGAVADALVRDGELQGDPERLIRLVTLSFLAQGGDGYPFPEGGGESLVELSAVLTEPGRATFAVPGTEQDALAEMLLARTSRAKPYAQKETDASTDTRVLNLSLVAEDTVY